MVVWPRESRIDGEYICTDEEQRWSSPPSPNVRTRTALAVRPVLLDMDHPRWSTDYVPRIFCLRFLISLDQRWPTSDVLAARVVVVWEK